MEKNCFQSVWVATDFVFGILPTSSVADCEVWQLAGGDFDVDSDSDGGGDRDCDGDSNSDVGGDFDGDRDSDGDGV